MFPCLRLKIFFETSFFGGVFWCFVVSDIEKFSSPRFWKCVLLFQTLKSFPVLVFGSVFWCFGVSDFEKFSSPHF